MKAKPKVEAAKSSKRTWNKEKKPVVCSHCGKSGHNDVN